MADTTTQHYERLARTYDDHWNYDPDHVRRVAEAMADALRLNSSDAIADIGCGTGLYARAIQRYIEPTRPMQCVDPSPAMLDRIPSEPGLRPVLGTAEEIASGRVGLPEPGPLDAVILKESIHHVTDREKTIAGLGGMLSDHGRMLIVLLPQSIRHPLFPEAHERFAALQPDPEEIRGMVETAGLRASLSTRTFHVAIERDRYLRMLESRYMSVLSEFSEDELAAGIEHFRRAYTDPVLRFDDHVVFVTGFVRPGGA